MLWKNIGEMLNEILMTEDKKVRENYKLHCLHRKNAIFKKTVGLFSFKNAFAI